MILWKNNKFLVLYSNNGCFLVVILEHQNIQARRTTVLERDISYVAWKGLTTETKAVYLVSINHFIASACQGFISQRLIVQSWVADNITN